MSYSYSKFDSRCQLSFLYGHRSLRVFFCHVQLVQARIEIRTVGVGTLGELLSTYDRMKRELVDDRDCGYWNKDYPSDSESI
jgi:hypothetical protein